jgi:integrase
MVRSATDCNGPKSSCNHEVVGSIPTPGSDNSPALDDCGWTFTIAHDGLVSTDCLRIVVRIRLHDVRDTMATLALQAGVHPKIVQEPLGHSAINVTMDVYSHVPGGAAGEREQDRCAVRQRMRLM